MRVGIDVSMLGSRVTGIGRYILSLSQALGRVGKDAEWVFLGSNPSLEELPNGKNVLAVPAIGLAGARRAIWMQTVLPGLTRRYRLDVLHCPDFSRPVSSPVPVVNTIHDLAFYASQPFFSWRKRLYKRGLCRLTLSRSDKIIAVSNFTRDEILRRFRIDPGKVVVVHNGVDVPVGGASSEARSLYLLYVGTLETRKNIVTLVEAFNSLRGRGRIPHRLVLAGQPGFGWGEIQSAIRRSPYRGEIESRGYLTPDEIVRLYRSADLFIYPSCYEGFGFPVLEAMSWEVPVVCSRAAALLEVAGDAAEFFEPSSADDLAAAIERVTGSADRRAILKQKGSERVKQFPWDQCALRHCEVYRSVLH